MKKGLKIIFVFVFVFAISGCFKDKVISYESNKNLEGTQFLRANDKESLFYNMNLALNEVQLLELSFSYNDGKTSTFGNLQLAAGNTIRESGLVLDSVYNAENVKIYLKDEVVWVSYPFKGVHGGIKDSIDNIVEELPLVLEHFGSKNVNKKEIKDSIDKEDFKNIDFNDIFSKHEVTFEKINGFHKITLTKDDELFLMEIDKFYRITKIEFASTEKAALMTITYPETMQLRYPAGLEGLTYNSIKKSLRLAGFDSVTDLFK